MLRLAGLRPTQLMRQTKLRGRHETSFLVVGVIGGGAILHWSRGRTNVVAIVVYKVIHAILTLREKKGRYQKMPVRICSLSEATSRFEAEERKAGKVRKKRVRMFDVSEDEDRAVLLSVERFGEKQMSTST